MVGERYHIRSPIATLILMLADIEAAMRADECLAAGDMEGEAVRLRIVKAVEELRQREPGDRAVHCRLLFTCHQVSRPADPRLNLGASQ